MLHTSKPAESVLQLEDVGFSGIILIEASEVSWGSGFLPKHVTAQHQDTYCRIFLYLQHLFTFNIHPLHLPSSHASISVSASRLKLQSLPFGLPLTPALSPLSIPLPLTQTLLKKYAQHSHLSAPSAPPCHTKSKKRKQCQRNLLNTAISPTPAPPYHTKSKKRNCLQRSRTAARKLCSLQDPA
ncbi:hypothetical protein K402DRAFT_247482 [Aulographum hederae CBS 113979]|uniref:Uncharacterized protein n=1 Tax=Aulographum hederae CBS 113979 TaxID=1176131 RepID=A0A6G1HAJ1_9PEZI|nr:hypothetical protein K402DRAFT_247482 [Aulographum hederae CBS 113979]